MIPAIPPFFGLRTLNIEKVVVRRQSDLKQEIFKFFNMTGVGCTFPAWCNHKKENRGTLLIIGKKLLIAGQFVRGKYFLLEGPCSSADIRGRRTFPGSDPKDITATMGGNAVIGPPELPHVVICYSTTCLGTKVLPVDRRL